MNKLKKFWGWIVLAITAILGIIVFVDRKKTTNVLKKTQNKIDSNEKEIAKLDGKIETVQEERKELTVEIEKQTDKIEDLKTQKENITIAERTTEDAVANIKKRTKRNKK
jgi:septal ring factor EnvC (AmiA/AmiB activator)